ncbi:hypothetical protein BKA67DRAFT_660148 [Truncatella angustata]|uniref:Uncharacterized protein n=1 Tax=Truncatella angustata TaxID=152316 RepID=A0A9P8UJZ1_9PEZI|nr:uncharacterized protein BKA67DRAFT_660148 [Truncatella angustata]KAH6653559.1 hypothetical protein BKA67DRAFT_660148 [Truncatella angustata]
MDFNTSAKSEVPHSEHIYMICQRSGTGVLTLLNGKVILSDGMNPHGAAHWACETKSGYLGFRNTAAGCYLSHDGGVNIVTTRNFLPFEMFNISPHRNGGYMLLSPYYWFAQKKIAIAENGESLIRHDAAGTAWDFVRVDGKSC